MINNSLDQLILHKTSAEKWEGKITTSERRAIIKYLVDSTIEKTNEKDSMREDSFEIIGFFLQWRKPVTNKKINLKALQVKLTFL